MRFNTAAPVKASEIFVNFYENQWCDSSLGCTAWHKSITIVGL